jgi:hypothetical protein
MSAESESLYDVLMAAVERAVCEALGVPVNPLHEAAAVGIRAQDVADSMGLTRARLYQLIDQPRGRERVALAVKAVVDERPPSAVQPYIDMAKRRPAGGG